MARKARPDYRRLAAADLSDLSLGADALGTDFRALHSELLSFGGYRTTGARSLPPAQLTPEWLQQNGAFRPTLIPAAPAAARELGIALPEGSLTVDRLASRIGIATEVHTMDVQTQGEGPRWTLHQWCLYWEARRAASREPPPALAAAGGGAGAGGLASGAPTGSLQQPGTARAGRPAEDEADSAAVKRKRTAEEEAAAQHLKGISAESKKRLLEVSALSLTGTALEAEVSPPTAVCAVDLAQQVWPEGAPSRPSTSVNLVMSPEGAYTDFHLAVGGSSVWLHCLSGRRVLALVPPTPRNLATYVAWAASARYAGVFLPAHCEGVLRLEMGPGDTLIIPGGWAHASATTASAVLLGGSFLRRDALALQLEAWRIEDHLAVRPRFRYPAFKQVLWYAAAAFARRLQRLSGLPGPELKQRVAERLAAMAEEEAAAAATRGADSQDSDSVSKAGAAKKKKGWLGEQREVADDAGTRRPQQAQEGHETPRSLPAGQRVPQPPALGLARAAASPTAAGLPRQVGRAAGGGGSRLRTAGGIGSGSRAAARAPASRLNPTQQGIDIRGSGGGGGGRRAAGGGGGGGGGGFGQRKRPRSPDSFIEQDSGGEDSDMAGSDEEAEGGVEWAPSRAAASRGEDEEMSEPDTDPDIDELAAAGYRHRYAAEEGGQAARPRRMTARQAAAAAKEAAAWDGRLARQAPAAAFDEFDEELLDDEDWEGGGGSGGRRGRQSTRFRGQLPPRMAALLQEEEAEEEEEAAAAAYLAAPHVTTAAAALAAFEAAAQQQPAAVAPAAAAGAGLKPVKIKVKAPAVPPAEHQVAAAFPPAAAQQPPASGIKIKIKPAGVQQQAQQAQQAQQPTIPQVDGAGDESGDEAPPAAAAAAAGGGRDELAAMYEALFDEEQPAQQGAAAAQPQAQQEQVPAALASPLGLQSRQPLPAQQAQQQATSKQEQDQPSEGGGMHRNASLAMWLEGGGAAEGQQRSQGGAGQQAAGSTGVQLELNGQPAKSPAAESAPQPRPASRQVSDSSQGQLAAGGQDSVAAHASGGSASPSVEGPVVSGGAAAAAAPEAAQPQQQLQATPPQQPAEQQQQEEQQQQQQQQQPPRSGGRAAQEERPAGSSGAPSPADAAGFAAGMAAANGAAAALAAAQPGAAAAMAPEEEEEDWDLDPAAPPAEPLSLEEEEGLAALLAALKDWLRKPHALNDVPLTISNPKAVVARLEVCMRELGLSLTPPPQVDFDSVPLERLLPVRTPRAGGLTGTLASHQTPQTAGGSEFVPGELDAVGELEEGGEFDPDDLEEEGEAPVVEESAGPKRKLALVSAAKPAGMAARAGGSAGRPPGAAALAPPAAKRSKASVKERLTKKLGLGKKR